MTSRHHRDRISARAPTTWRKQVVTPEIRSSFSATLQISMISSTLDGFHPALHTHIFQPGSSPGKKRWVRRVKCLHHADFIHDDPWILRIHMEE